MLVVTIVVVVNMYNSVCECLCLFFGEATKRYVFVCARVGFENANHCK